MSTLFPTSQRPALSSYEEAKAVGLTMDASRHYIIENDPWIGSLIDHTGNDRLFLYLHLETGAFVLAAWIFAPGEEGVDQGICVELQLWDNHPAIKRVAIPLAAALLKSAEEEKDNTIKLYRDAQKTRLQMHEDAAAERDGLIKHLRKQGHEDEAREIQTGRAPTMMRSESNVEEYDAACERLQVLAKIAGMSHKERGAVKRQSAEWGTR